MAVNGIIGAGIFGLPSKVYALIGTYSLLAFAVCAVVATLIILCFAEVGSRFRETGGPYLYAREALGPVVGFEVGWLMWLARLTAFAANGNLLIGYLGYFWEPAGSGIWRAVIITAVVVLITVVNVIGVRNAARVSTFFTIGKLIPIVLFIAVGLFFVAPERFSASAAPGYPEFSTSVLLLVYAFTGFEMAVIPAGEVRDPQRDLPLALLAAIALVAAAYLLIQVVCIGTLPDLAGSERPLADAARRFLGPAGAAIIAAGAVVSITGNLLVLCLAGARLPFAMAQRAELPRILGAIHPRFRTPHCAIILTSGIALLLTVFGSFVSALTISTLARLVSYAATCGALLILRRKAGAPAAKFSVPAGPAVAIVTLAVIVWLLCNGTAREAAQTAVAAAVGLLICVTGRSFARATR